MRRMVAGVVGVFAAVVIPSADAQNYAGYPPSWTPDAYYVDESAGEVVLTLRFPIPGRIMYRTVDREAQAPEDYTAVSGEVVFTSGGTRTIRIPIVADDLDEPVYSESFIVEAWEELEPAAGPIDRDPGGASATVFIVDDDEVGDAGPLGSGVGTGPPPPTSTTTSTTLPRSDVGAELASEELLPGPGFELPHDGSVEPVRERGARGGGTPTGLAFGVGASALGVGAISWVQRRRRWSSSQP